MNSRWGFVLDMSAVRLMRRDGDRWREVAVEKIDGPDIEDRLKTMAAKVEPGQPVELFLPRDQILYTDVKVSSTAAVPSEIEKALDGRTPYALDELEFDWVMGDGGIAAVAAIARETLDEAADFAAARGLAVAGFSSLAEPSDFPRNPVFGSAAANEADAVPDAAPEPEAAPETDAAPEPTFTSVRDRTSETPRPLSAPEPEGPVLLVDDDRPVLQVKDSPLPPLNPGKALDSVPTAPRVRTDIAAGTQSGAAATLKPAEPSIRVRTSASRPRQTLIVFAVAAILTIGIATIVWSILPLAPGRSDSTPTEDIQTGLATTEPAPTEETAEALPDLPLPEVSTEFAGLAPAPEIETGPAAPATARGDIDRRGARLLPPAAVDAAPLPVVPGAPERSPEKLALIQTTDPVQGLDGAEDAAETTLDIYLASIERRDLASDAIALPAPGAFDVERLPLVTGAPGSLDDAAPEIASVDPGAAVPEPEVIAAPSDEPPSSAALRPTALAAALPDLAPRPRPGNFVEEIERDIFGGRTRDELARIAPRARPQSAQIVAQTDRPAADASELAVATSVAPRARPSDFDAIVATAVIQSRTDQVTTRLDFETPDTSDAIEAALADDAEPEEPGTRPQDSPRLAIPSSASVSRQATIEDAIPLNRINLVGVYGVPSDRRALVRLSSGRYVKVKVGDRIDGGTVAQINDSELIYRKGSRTLSLALPKG